ncbi:MAG: Ig domain-containing protein [Gemmatimonadaceae bacterium]
MQSMVLIAKRVAVRSLLLLLAPALVVCSGDTSTGTGNPPGSISDLMVSAIASTSVTLKFTQVDDGTGEAASYDVRYAVAPISWGAASPTANGTCATPLAGTGIGTPLTCSILGLTPGTSYNFQLIAFRGTLNSDATFGGASNIASASTPALPPPPPTVTTVTVTPPSISIGVGATANLQATVKDADGNLMNGQTITWSTSDAAVATVSSGGVVTGVAAGSATITASCAGKSATAAITVTASPPPPPVVTTVTVAPATASINVAGTVALTATVKDADGNVMSGQSITWSTSNGAAATVSSSGVVTGVAAGSATITASCAGKSGTASIAVTASPPPPPVVTTVTVAPSTASINVAATVNLSATVKDAQGNVMTGQTITWSSSNTSIASVSTGGVVTGVAQGSATITATCAGKSGTSAITVTAVPPPPPVVTTVTVAPATASINVGATVSLAATVKDAQGNVMTGQTITWSSSNSSAASVNTSGVVSGVAQGTATITATCSGKSGTSSVTVTAPSSGGTLLFQEDFENASLGSRGWYDNTSASISTAEHVTGSTASAQYHFLSGANTPTSGGSQRHKFTPSNSFYVSFYVKYSTNWVGSGQAYHPHEFYLLSTMDGDYDGPSDNFLDVYIEHNYQNGGRPRFAMQDNKAVNTSNGAVPNNLIGVTENRSTGGCNGVVETNIFSECYNAGTYWYNDKQLTGPVTFQPNPGTGYKNNWNFVEAYFQLNTIVNGIGQADGVMQYWFNGALIIDRHDILFRTGARPTLQFSQFIIAPYIGDGSPADQSMWIDNLKVATGRIP